MSTDSTEYVPVPRTNIVGHITVLYYMYKYMYCCVISLHLYTTLSVRVLYRGGRRTAGPAT